MNVRDHSNIVDLVFPNSWYNYRVLVGYFRESRGPKIWCRWLPGCLSLGLLLTSVVHFRHFLGLRCRTGAGPVLGPSLVPKGTLQEAPRTTHGSPREPPRDPEGHPFGPSLVLVWSQIGLIQVPIQLPSQVPIQVPIQITILPPI